MLLYTAGRVVVEATGRTGDSPLVPTIAALLTSYRDQTGDSYEDMARKVGNEITRGRLQQLATAPPKGFPERARTVEILSDLLQVPIPTIVLAYAAGLGLAIPESQPMLALTLPPGTDSLTDRDRAAVRAVIASLVEARRAAVNPGPDLSDPAVQGRRIVERDGSPASARHDA